MISFIFKEKKNPMFIGTFRCVTNKLVVEKKNVLCVEIFRHIKENNKNIFL